MTIVEPTSRSTFQRVTVDLYRDIHKGIRGELFALTTDSGRLDPGDRDDRIALSAHVADVVALLGSHAEHEDTHVGPALELHLPDLAATIEQDHHRLDSWLERVQDMTASAVDVVTAAEQRDALHRIYLELAAFTSSYLEHQDLEERVVMPALESAVGVESVLAIHQAIVSSIPPDQMGQSLALMLPAMNVDDRTELLAGMQAGAPPEVFGGVWSLAGTVLTPADHTALGRRLGLA